MRAIVVYEPGGPEVLRLEERPVPEARPGWVVVRVRAFGLNRAELMTRAGGSGASVAFPRVIGIECVGEVADPSDSDLGEGQRVVAVMGGMGREYDGSYEQYALLPMRSVIPVETSLAWERLAAIPETYGTAWGSLATLDLQPGQTLLIRGGSSSVGMAAATIARDRGVTVLSTTRQERKRERLLHAGAHQVLIDGGSVVEQVTAIAPGGVDALFELVGPTAMRDSLSATRRGGRACISGFLEQDWETEAVERAAAEREVAFGRFGSNAITRDTYSGVMQETVAGVESGRFAEILERTFTMDTIADAHRLMEANDVAGKLVGLTD
jgi:NADPH:quinone reductase-like Zn-dependent oxidoreductase